MEKATSYRQFTYDGGSTLQRNESSSVVLRRPTRSTTTPVMDDFGVPVHCTTTSSLQDVTRSSYQ